MRPPEIPSFDDLRFQLDEHPDYATLGSVLGDRRDGRVYVHVAAIRSAVRVALATGRPLLVRGPPGSGKSSLATFFARALNRRFYVHTVNARTQARDLLWRFDAVARLSDAQLRRDDGARTPRFEHLEHYIEPGVLWWAFDAVSARLRGAAEGLAPSVKPALDPGVGPAGRPAVVLIDEIDKADPDVPNNLLEPLGSLQFTVEELGRPVRASAPPLVFITTNDERELPAAFKRRCAVLYLEAQPPDGLVDIALQHFAAHDPAPTQDLCRAVAKELARLGEEAAGRGDRAPSTAEYLDAVRACLCLDADPARGGEWTDVARLTLEKQPPSAASLWPGTPAQGRG